MTFNELKAMLEACPRDLYDQCDAFKECTPEEYKALASAAEIAGMTHVAGARTALIPVGAGVMKGETAW